jgi:peptidoglycan-associated lipoprotein
MRRFASGAAILLALSLTAGACAKKAPEMPPPADPPATVETKPEPPPPPPPPKPEPKPPAPTEDEIFAKKTLAQLNAEKLLADVYFAYDSTDLSAEARSSLEKNLQFLNRWPSTKIMIEGHADSRGTNEYNLALAERRAAAVRDYLASLGLSADRMNIVSKGEEQPFCTDETEACWQQNRVGHFIFTEK